MIKNINMCECATFDKDGASISDCKKINFIYGANGSGKTTISNFLQSRTENPYSRCSIDWCDATCEDIIVYNRKFKEQNIRQTEIPGVFTMGQATIEQQQELETLKAERTNQVDEKSKTYQTLEKKKEEKVERIKKFRLDLWSNVFQKYDKPFAEAFTGTRNSKDKFSTEALNRFAMYDVNDDTYDSLLKRAQTLFGERPNMCAEINISIDYFKEKIKNIEDNSLWSTSVVGSDDVPIEKLIRKMNSDDWVSSGTTFLSEGSNICPFCQKPTITDDFRKQLEDFFDTSYKEEKSKLNVLLEQYIEKSQALIDTLNTDALEKESIEVGHLNLTSIDAEIRIIEQVSANNIKTIKEKINEPTKKVSLESIDSNCDVIIKQIESANIEIQKHNKLVEDYETEKKKLIGDIWNYIIRENKQLFDDYSKEIKNLGSAINGITRKLESLEENIKTTEEKILEKGRNITSVQPPVDEINRLLKAYGFTSFSIAPSNTKDNSYQIQRPDGSLATNTLSEGEETFISFLYFMQIQKGSVDQEKVANKKIIVLDDPISSLDSTILYIVSAMVKDLIRSVLAGNSDVSQVFILTHNVFFHKEASFVEGKQDNQNSNINYWIVSKDRNISGITSYKMENPIRTSYELLWKELRDSTTSSLVTVQNTMRRIIENYFGMLGKNRDAYIESQFDTAEEQMICKSLFYWINDGSHTITDDLFIDPYTDSIERYMEVFRKIFIKTGNEAHYNMMMGIIND